MASWVRVLPVEIRQAVAETFSELGVVTPPRLFGKGFLSGLGPTERQLLCESKSDEQVELLERIASLPGAIFDLLTFPNESGRRKQNIKINELDTATAQAADNLRQVRRPHSVEIWRRAQYAGYTLHHQNLLIPALASAGRSLDDFLGLQIGELKKFWANVPSLDVDCEMSLYRDRQWTRLVQENDVRDLGHLALAVPYCDVVVTERFWSRAAVETGISDKYNTVVCANLGDVLDLIN